MRAVGGVERFESSPTHAFLHIFYTRLKVGYNAVSVAAHLTPP